MRPEISDSSENGLEPVLSVLDRNKHGHYKHKLTAKCQSQTEVTAELNFYTLL